uniref:Uncharacterized protein n=1 Tax=Setaria viridis TaxID=4556 RepID=A0A4V6D4J9_SETVI|nr:hypothetical protein SEVIR_7G258400v2 [Setaria viridis]
MSPRWLDSGPSPACGCRGFTWKLVPFISSVLPRCHLHCSHFSALHPWERMRYASTHCRSHLVLSSYSSLLCSEATPMRIEMAWHY